MFSLVQRIIPMIFLTLSATASAHSLKDQHAMIKVDPYIVDKSDRVAIESAIMDYLHGYLTADGRRLERAFVVDQATMVGVVPGNDGNEVIQSWKDMRTVISEWSKASPPPGDSEDAEIASLSVVDGRMAIAFLRFKNEFYDALTLVKRDGRWAIVGKSFILQRK